VLAAERRDLLVDRLRHDGRLVSRQMADELGVPEHVLRRDLRDLAAAGLCQRVYGGALPASPITADFAHRAAAVPDNKLRVAARAAALISPGSTVILDAGTTCLAVAQEMAPGLVATVVTRSPAVATVLVAHQAVDVVLLGGRVLKSVASTCGAAAAEVAGGISADLFLMGIAAVHPRDGFMTDDLEDAAMKRILISRAAETYVLASSEKLGTASSHRIVGLSGVAGVVTDAPPGHPAVEQFAEQGARVIHA
jgi:DeoR/GlpR family transcriptional regulator of sugar metabolism